MNPRFGFFVHPSIPIIDSSTFTMASPTPLYALFIQPSRSTRPPVPAYLSSSIGSPITTSFCQSFPVSHLEHVPPTPVSINVDDDNDEEMSSSLDQQSEGDVTIDSVSSDVSSSSSNRSSKSQRRPIYSVSELKSSERMELTGTYPWLLIDGNFSCSVCRECRSDPDVSSRNKWITRRDTLQRRYADDHQSSGGHKLAKQALFKRKQQPHSTLDSQFDEQHRHELTYLKAFIATAYFLAVRQMPTIHYQPMLELMAQLKLLMPGVYRSRQACGLFQELISQMLKDELTMTLQDELYGLIIDESTDITAQKTLIVYVRYLRRMTPVTNFLSLIPVTNGDADSIITTLLKYLKDSKIDSCQPSRLVGFASDGASVMTGKRDGVAVQLAKQLNPHLISVHCSAHRTELVCKDSADDNNTVTIYLGLLKKMFAFYNKSSLRGGNLSRHQQLLGLGQHKLIQPAATRWLSLYDSSVRLKEQHQAVVASLMSLMSVDNDAALYLEQITCIEFLVMMHFMVAILTPVKLLCLKAQQINLNISDLSSSVTATVKQLTDLQLVKTVDSESPENSENTENPENRSIEHFSFSDSIQTEYLPLHKLVTGCNGQIANNQSEHILYPNTVAECPVKISKESLISAVDSAGLFGAMLLKNVLLRFPNVTIYDSFVVFNYKRWPQVLQADFGEKEITALADFYGRQNGSFSRKVSGITVVAEWKEVRDIILKQYRSNDNIYGTWQLLDDSHGLHMPSLFYLVKVSFILPVSSADAERGFSKQNNIIKSVKRSRLKPRYLDQLIRISSNGEQSLKEEQFDRIMQLWEQSNWQHRREDVLENNHPTINIDDEDPDEEESTNDDPTVDTDLLFIMTVPELPRKNKKKRKPDNDNINDINNNSISNENSTVAAESPAVVDSDVLTSVVVGEEEKKNEEKKHEEESKCDPAIYQRFIQKFISNFPKVAAKKKWNTDDENLVTDAAIKNEPPISILIKQIRLDIQREYKAKQQLDEPPDPAAVGVSNTQYDYERLYIMYGYIRRR